MKFIERVCENAVKHKDYNLLADDTCPKGLTYGKVDEISGRVYNYLHSKGLGKDDFVMLCLPRGIKPIISMIGVWKNGSAFVLVEDNYAPERIEFIKSNCNCKLVIDSDAWEEIQTYDYKAGFEETDENDAAFAVYTSGTTGNPKGVLHEYGNLERMVDSVNMRTCAPLATQEDRFALVAPLNFVASMLIIVYGLEHAVFNYVVSYKTIKNPALLGMFIIMNRITGTFLTPSHIRKMGNKIEKLGLKFCIIGSEPANEVYLDGVTIHNFYLMSESGFAVTHYVIDKLYEQTPVGNSEFGHDILLLDEQGKSVADGEEGEVCFENKYVRGYINLPEETAKAFRNGLYHTGDLARKDENGNLIICGRLSDMVKINGNRVEPGEIENVAKKVLNVDWTAARIFDDGKRVFIALYYTADIDIDEERVRKEMELYLPYYMIPSFFMHIDSVPLRPNGKMDRKALPKPNFDDFKKDYVEPRDEIEKALCSAFEKALNVDQIGINDDFYQLGGDSMASMDVVANSGLSGLSATHIFRGHTVEKIAELYKKEAMDESGIDLNEYNKKCIEHPQPLSSGQLYMVDYQMYTPKSTMYNLFQMMKFDKSMIDMQKLADAIKVSAFNHPAILTTFFFNEDGEMMQKYTPEIWKDVEVEKISEKELNEIKDTLVQPFKIVNSPLFRTRIFETEEAGYLFMDVHHTIFDGTSSKVFFGDILKAYFGQDLEPDYYYVNLRRNTKQIDSDYYRESKEYFEKKYGNVKWSIRPKTDHEVRENTISEYIFPLILDEKKYEKLLKVNNLTPNAFFLTANLIATAMYNKKTNIMYSWIYNGRGSANDMNISGLLYKDLPVGIKFNKKLKIDNLYKEVVEQINGGIEHSCYPYVEMGKAAVIDDVACVLYQDNLRELNDMPGLLGEVEIRQNEAAAQAVLDVEIRNTVEGMKCVMEYAASRYDVISMDKYAKYLQTVIKLLIAGVDDDITVKQLMVNVNTTLGIGNFISNLFGFRWLK